MGQRLASLNVRANPGPVVCGSMWSTARPTSGPCHPSIEKLRRIDRWECPVDPFGRRAFDWGPTRRRARDRSKRVVIRFNPIFSRRLSPRLARGGGEMQPPAPNPASPADGGWLSFLSHAPFLTPFTSSHFPNPQPHASHRRQGTGLAPHTPRADTHDDGGGGRRTEAHLIVIGVIETHRAPCGGPSPPASWRWRSPGRPPRRRAARCVLLY